MRVMVLVKASAESEAGAMPSTELLAAMGRFNEELVQAGVMVAGEGLHPSSKGRRVRFDGSERTVSEGPFPDTAGLVAGFWLWQVKSMDEAVAWARRCPNPMPGGGELELRQVFEAEDFGEEFTPELRAQEEGLRTKLDMRLGAFSVSLAVKDLQASRAFYEKFGFTPFMGDGRHWQIMRNGSHVIGLFQGMFEGNLLTFNPGWDSDAKPVGAFTDVRELQRRLKTQGVQLVTEADESTTGPASFVAVDPDGNTILVDQHV